jgi:hypothetical protein
MIHNSKNLKKFGDKIKNAKIKRIKIFGYASQEKIPIEETELQLPKIWNKLNLSFLVTPQIAAAAQPLFKNICRILSSIIRENLTLDATFWLQQSME